MSTKRGDKNLQVAASAALTELAKRFLATTGIEILKHADKKSICLLWEAISVNKRGIDQYYTTRMKQGESGLTSGKRRGRKKQQIVLEFKHSQ